ncbi:type II-A CRISPR-associated protein Csn2 [Amygdalobacter indicium]|uniref:type II-A CRISPR-associated protein Csn2 n=1 Tax=Amygdalobacter indicium TaxID=3029272 RepID=UPI0027A2F424|nr:type II-A CRISPR-associated protein Csn2 [Amygdalobacter indicium]WEG34162.1 type II-A CRISPR-associated protein Csn2 [Amygdalobacter indicium]
MLNLNYYFLEEPISIKGMTVLAVENTRAYVRLVEDFYKYNLAETDELKLFYSDQKDVAPNNVVLISDVWNYKINSVSLLKKIYEDLQRQIKVNVELKAKIEQILFELDSLLQEELLEHELDLTSRVPELTSIFKFFEVQCAAREETVFGKIQEIISVYSYWQKKYLLVFVNCLAYFTTAEIKELEKYIALNGLDILFLEPRKVPEFRGIYLDDDLFLLK